MQPLIALLLCACLYAQPKPPQAAGGADRKQDQGHSEKNQQSPPTDQLTTTNPATESHPVPEQRNQDTRADRQIADYTEALAHYTLALVVVGILQFAALGVQGVFLFRAFRETQAATRLTRESNAEVSRANAVTEALTAQSNEITRIATELTHQSILLTHRPKLIVRSFQDAMTNRNDSRWDVPDSQRWRHESSNCDNLCDCDCRQPPADEIALRRLAR